jgi:hypothetical protein
MQRWGGASVLQKFFALFPKANILSAPFSIHAPLKPFVAFTGALIFLRFIIQQQL